MDRLMDRVMDRLTDRSAGRLKLLPIVGFVLAIAGSAFLLTRIEMAPLIEALAGASWSLVLAAAAINLTVNQSARIGRWSALLAPLPRRHDPKPRDLSHILFASGALSNLLPWRAGEGLRAIVLSKRHGFPVGSVIASQLLEKLVEAASLLSLAALTIALFELPRPIHVAAIGLALLAGAGIAIAVALSRSARSPRVWLASLAWSLVSDLTDVTMIGLCLLAVGVSISPLAWCATFVAINLAIAVPSTPGQIGALEAAATLTLSALGVPAERALAFAVLYHAAHLVPSTLVGLYSLSSLRTVAT